MKKSTKRELSLTIGTAIICFIIGSGIVAEIFTRKPWLYDKETPLDGNEDIKVTADDPPADPTNESSWWIYPELQPYQIYIAPQINWDKFWSVFKNHSMWSLEGYNPVTEEWEQDNSYLTIHRNYTENNQCKIGLEFTAPYTTDYRLTVAIDYAVKQYLNKSVHNIVQ